MAGTNDPENERTGDTLIELNLQVLGAFRVQDAAGAEIRIASRKGRALLAYLALRPGESHSRDRLATLDRKSVV